MKYLKKALSIALLLTLATLIAGSSAEQNNINDIFIFQSPNPASSSGRPAGGGGGDIVVFDIVDAASSSRPAGGGGHVKVLDSGLYF